MWYTSEKNISCTNIYSNNIDQSVTHELGHYMNILHTDDHSYLPPAHGKTTHKIHILLIIVIRNL